MRLRQALGIIAIIFALLSLYHGYGEYRGIIAVLRGEAHLIDTPLEGEIYHFAIGLVIDFILFTLGIFLLMFKGTSTQVVGVVISVSSIIFFIEGYSAIYGGTFYRILPSRAKVQELAIVSLILLAIGIFLIAYKGKSSSQTTASSTTTT